MTDLTLTTVPSLAALDWSSTLGLVAGMDGVGPMAVIAAPELYFDYPVKGLVSLAWAQEPYRLVWALRSDGKAVAMTYRRDQEVVGWQRIETDGAIESMAVIPTPDGSSDEIWAVVRREIGGVPQRYIERQAQPFDPVSPDDKHGAIYLDSAVAYQGAAETRFDNLDHLEGKTVQVWADGARRPDTVVTDGAVTLATPASKVLIGLGYASRVTTLRASQPTATGPIQGRGKRIHRTTLRLRDCGGGRIGRKGGRLRDLVFRDGADPLDGAPPWFTGDKRVQIDEGFDTDGRLTLEADGPEPFTLVALISELLVGDD